MVQFALTVFIKVAQTEMLPQIFSFNFQYTNLPKNQKN